MKSVSRILSVFFFLLLTLQSVPLLAETDGKIHIFDTPSAYIATDKPVYRNGETLRIHGVFLSSWGNLPCKEPMQHKVIITDARKKEVFQEETFGNLPTAGLSWTLPDTLPGGEYTIAWTVNNWAVGLRKFEVRNYLPERLNKNLSFLKQAVLPGETIEAILTVNRMEGGGASGAKITASALVQGTEFFSLSEQNLPEDGQLLISVPLPKDLDNPDCVLNITIQDGGVIENCAKTIPVILENMTLEFFPESGDLVPAGKNTVYFQALRLDGKPADVTGKILNSNGDILAEFSSSHEGRGKFEFTPLPGENYVALLSNGKTFSLPDIRHNGALLHTEKACFAYTDPIEILFSATPQALPGAEIILSKRAKILDRQPATERVTLSPGEAEGVLCVTACDGNGTPLAERLIFRAPKYKINISLTVDQPSAAPGDHLKLKIKTTDGNHNPVESTVNLTVVDSVSSALLESRERPPLLPEMVYLESEVAAFADANRYLLPDGTADEEKLDLLLGIQGWRRFVRYHWQEALEKDPERIKTILGYIGLEPFVPPYPAPEPLLLLEDGALPINALPAGALAKGVEVFAEKEQAMVTRDALPAPQLPLLPMQDPDRQRRKVLPEKPGAELWIREYRHQKSPTHRPGQRQDFTETVYWSSAITTNARTGEAEVEFDLSDAISTFQIRANAFAANGALGSAISSIQSVEPFFIDPKLPMTVTVGDQLEIPIALTNNTPKNFDSVALTLSVSGPDRNGLVLEPLPALPLSANARNRIIAPVRAKTPGTYTLHFAAAANNCLDSVSKVLRVVPEGFEITTQAGGMLSPGQEVSWEFEVPENIQPGSLSSTISLLPGTKSQLEEAVKSLIAKPYGCFEQTSSVSFPMVMAEQYLTRRNQHNSAKARKFLTESYQKLTSFECPSGGFEWFGNEPAHEALTAYGLLQFTEMSKVYPVDPALLERTKNWLLSRRDGKGNFRNNSGGLDSFNAIPDRVVNEYILWCLLRAGAKSELLATEIEQCLTRAEAGGDPYNLALSTNIALLANQPQRAEFLLKHLEEAIGDSITVTHSPPPSARIEVTALHLLALIALGDDYQLQARELFRTLLDCGRGGRFGNTQGTILSLMAILEAEDAFAVERQSGSVSMQINGNAVGKTVPFAETVDHSIAMPDPTVLLTPGKRHQLVMQMVDGFPMAWSSQMTYHTTLPPSSESAPLKISTALSANTVKEGELLTCKLSLLVPGPDPVRMPVAILGLPAGTEVRHDQLKELTASGKIAAYETGDRELILYFRSLPPGNTELHLQLSAVLPGNFTGPASRAYGYYEDDLQSYSAPLNITIGN